MLNWRLMLIRFLQRTSHAAVRSFEVKLRFFIKEYLHLILKLNSMLMTLILHKKAPTTSGCIFFTGASFSSYRIRRKNIGGDEFKALRYTMS